jgi:hypothetical protein|tara:strand:- start:15 stop:269 length:255 start_codon:yes stop_codon:yes gene_type:complete
MTKEQIIEIHLLMATFRCFNEQLYNVKGTHSGVMKMKFNRLLKVARQYEREIVEFNEGSKELELIYDNMMDLLIEIKKQINEQN